MAKDVKGIIRVVAGYNKIPDEDGDQLVEVKYKLKPIDLSCLQKLFNINPDTAMPIDRDLFLCYDIDEEKAKALQPYVIDGIIDLEKYDFMLHCFAEDPD